jgi:hypothetical protein
MDDVVSDEMRSDARQEDTAAKPNRTPRRRQSASVVAERTEYREGAGQAQNTSGSVVPVKSGREVDERIGMGDGVPTCVTCPYYFGMPGVCKRWPPVRIERMVGPEKRVEYIQAKVYVDTICGEHPDFPVSRGR